MVFNSLTFVAFFIVMLILHNLPFSWKVKKINLLLASYVFYAAWNPPFILLLWLSTVVDFFVGRALYNQQNKHKRKLLLVVSLIGNLGMLCFFKYGGFILENFTSLVNLLGMDYHPAKPNIILPAGISFYTFTTLCYTIDMYKRKSEPVKSMLDFSLFVTFFPHLVAGPIVRPPQLVPQFETPRKATQQQLMNGLFLLSIGLFMKVVLADSMLAATADSIFGSAREPYGALDAWTGVLAFSGQIFFDFAGYSTCAIGVAACLGFVLPENFLYPYGAIGFSDFWRRWHITLSAWLRDYLYIPLGGNRKGKFRTYINLMITMLLGGLWHGANWTFVVWGALHGFYLWMEKIVQGFSRVKVIPISAAPSGEVGVLGVLPAPLKTKTFRNFLLAMVTFFFINVTWVFFRAPDFHSAWMLLKSMFNVYPKATPSLATLSIIKVGVIVVFMVAFHWLMRDTKVLSVAGKMPWWLVGLIWSVLILLLVWSQESSSSFIYFQF
ncbi:MAG: MBOAT family protein [Chitinophagaceae bacterium]|nr:MBOAT family protein [Chitinophagaceae bacterium]